MTYINHPSIYGWYIKKPTPQEFLEAIGMDDLNARNLKWQKTAIDGGEVWNERYKMWIEFTFGDVLNITDSQDVYPVPREIFLSTYVPMSLD